MIKLFLKYRDVFAVCMFVFGLPLVYFFRDGLALATNNPVVTAVAILGPMALTLPFKNLKKFYEPNLVAYSMGLTLMFIFSIYLIFRSPYLTGSVRMDYVTIPIIFFLFYVFVNISFESVSRNFLTIGLILSVLGCLGLIYAIIKDPTFVMGQRFSIRTNTESAESQGNPHIFSRVAYFGIVLCFLLIKYIKNYKVNIVVPIAFMVLFFAILVFTQTLLANLATLGFLFLFLVYNFSVTSFWRSLLHLLTKWYVLVILIFGFYKLSLVINENQKIIEPVVNYITTRSEKVIDTIFGSDNKKDEVDLDSSANTRVAIFKAFIELMQENFEEGNIRYILFGNGYFWVYMDNPLFEVFNSFGFFMFLFYGYFVYYLTKMCYFEIRSPQSVVTEFIAYGFIYYFIMNLTAGLVIDHTRWGYYIIVMRFLNRKP